MSHVVCSFLFTNDKVPVPGYVVVCCVLTAIYLRFLLIIYWMFFRL